jgi:arginyl-tRNA synthetase
MHNQTKESMKERLASIIEGAIGVPANVLEEARENFGHYTTPVALRLAKEKGVNPKELASELALKIKAAADIFEKVEVAGPGFINMWLTAAAVQDAFSVAAQDAEFGHLETLKGRKVMVEYTDPNPFKEFHIGHLMTNMIGEALSRVHEAAGAEVLRVNYQGDVGLHVAKSVWGMAQLKGEMPGDDVSPQARSAFLGRAYAAGQRPMKARPRRK